RREHVDSLARALGVPPPKFPPAWLMALGGSLTSLMSRSVRVSNRRLRAAGWRPVFPRPRGGWKATGAAMAWRGPARGGPGAGAAGGGGGRGRRGGAPRPPPGRGPPAAPFLPRFRPPRLVVVAAGGGEEGGVVVGPFFAATPGRALARPARLHRRLVERVDRG